MCSYVHNGHKPDYDPVTPGLLGQAAGDAFGVPVEFMSREEVRKIDLQDMTGREHHPPFYSRWSRLIPSGAWSDDTSMTVAAMESMVSKQGRFDEDDVMRQFIAWWDEGKYTSLGRPFGLGGNVGNAMDRYRQGTPAAACGGKNFWDNGNGALMRIFPFAIASIVRGYDDVRTLDFVRRGASLTHAHEICIMSCYLYTLFLAACLRTGDAKKAYEKVFPGRAEEYGKLFAPETVKAHDLVLNHLCDPAFDPDVIPEGGYVVDSLSVAVFSLVHTDCYEDAVKMAVNFGYDTDTNAAIAGSVAGAMYGMEQIPERWLQALRKKDELLSLGARFSACLRESGGKDA